MASVNWKDAVKRSALAAFLVSFAYSIATIYLNQQFPRVLDPLILGVFLTLSISIACMGLALSIHAVLTRVAGTNLRVGPVPIDAAWLSGFILIFFLLFARIYTVGIYPDDWFWSSPWMSLLAWVIRLILFFLIAALAAQILAWLVSRIFAKRYLRIAVTLSAVLSFLTLCVVTSIERVVPAADQVQLQQPVSPHIVVFGIDGMDYRLVQEFVKAGKMPHLESLMAEAAVAPLRTVDIASSPRIWGTIATGKKPREHGVLDHVEHRLVGMKGTFYFPARTGANHLLAPLFEQLGLLERTRTTNRLRRSPALWNIASMHEKSVAVLNWINGRPADSVNGYFVSPEVARLLRRSARTQTDSGEGQMSAQRLLGFVWPPEFAQTVVSLGDDFSYFGIARMLMEEDDKPNLLAIYDTRIDGAEHKHWASFQPEKFLGVSAEKIERFGNAILEAHVETDELIGRLRSALPDDAIMIILSDHGHGPAFLENMNNKGGHNNNPDGVLIVSGNGIAAGATIRQPTVYDITPTVLHMMGLPVAEDMSGRVLEEIFEKQTSRDPQWIASYGTWRASAHELSDDAEVDQEALEELKTLGYIR